MKISPSYCNTQKKSIKNVQPIVLSRTSTRHQKRKIDDMERKSAMELEIENLSKINPLPSNDAEYEISEQDITLEVELEKEVDVEVAIPAKVKKATPKKAVKKSEITANLVEKEKEIVILKSSKLSEPRISSRNKKLNEEVESIIPTSTRTKKLRGL